MTYLWRYEALADGLAQPAGLSETFGSQSDAETWIGENWRALLDDGIDQVTLMEGDRDVYGPMSLHPAG